MMTSSVFSQFYQVIEDAKPFADRYLPDKAHELLESSRQKVNEQTLTIQMYGAYNAGKSTFINVFIEVDGIDAFIHVIFATLPG